MALIFVLDDDVGLRGFIRDILEENHYQVESFEKPSLLFKALEEGGKPDVITTDFEMPEMNGLEVIQGLKADEKTRQIPVVLISSMVYDPELCEKVLTAGAAKTIPKPLKISELLKDIAELIH